MKIDFYSIKTTASKLFCNCEDAADLLWLIDFWKKNNSSCSSVAEAEGVITALAYYFTDFCFSVAYLTNSEGSDGLISEIDTTFSEDFSARDVSLVAEHRAKMRELLIHQYDNPFILAWEWLQIIGEEGNLITPASDYIKKLYSIEW